MAAAAALMLLLGDGVDAQTVGPGPIAGPVNVPSGTTTVVGSTAITSIGTNAGVNATSTGVAILDTSAGPSPGLISVQTANGNALQAASGGTISVPFPGLTVLSGGGHAALANGAGSSITFSNGATLGTTGVGSGLVAFGSGALINATGVTVNNTGTASAGHGAVAESGGVINLHAGTQIATTAFNSIALGASGAGSQVNADALIPVTSNGRGGIAVYMHDGGLVSLLPGSTFNLNGTSSVGIVVDNTTVPLGTIGSGLTVNLNGVGVAGQAGSTGIYAVNGGNLSIANVTITGQNAAAGVWAATGSTVTLTGQNTININAEQNQTAYFLSPASPNIVTASGQVSGGFTTSAATPIAGLFTLGGTINSTGTTINVASNNFATGVEAGNGGIVNLTSNIITATGTNSFGLRVDGGGTIIGNSSSVAASGGGAGVAFNSAPGTVSLTNSTVLATGAGTEGMTALNFSVGGTNAFSMSGGSLVSEASTGMAVRGPINISFTNGAMARGGNGFLIAAFDNPGGFQQTNAQLSASGGSTLFGDAFAQPGSILDISLLTGSQWTGAALDVTNVSVDPSSVWTMTASSTVTQQVTNAGLIDFTPPVGGAFKTLTTQSYLGLGGTIGLNTFLGADASPSDKLAINGGTASGSSKLKITNAGGLGDLTVANGILVVDAINGGTTVPGTFILSGPVVAGPYEYLLFRGSRDASAPENWFLRSTLTPTLGSTPCPAPVSPTPTPSVSPTPTPSVSPTPTPPVPPEPPNFRQETSLYAALPGLSLLYGRMLVDTLHQRVGEEEQLRARTDLGPGPYANGAWGRVIAQTGNRDGGCPVLVGPSSDFDMVAIQAGFDLYRLQLAGYRSHSGVYGALGNGHADVTHLNSIAAGRDSFAAYTTGGYWTLFGPAGWYVDSVVQGTFFDMRGQSTRFPALETDGWGFAASLEGGLPWRLGGLLTGWVVEPQAQLVYQSIDLGTSRDIGATVRFDEIESLAGRVGIRFATTWTLPAAWWPLAQPSLVTTWFRPNYWHEFSGDARTLFSSETGFIPFRANLGEDWVELNSGITLQVDRATSLYANASYQIAVMPGTGRSGSGSIGRDRMASPTKFLNALATKAVSAISLAVLAVSVAPPLANAQQVVADGVPATASGTINTGVLPPTAGYALYALNGGVIDSSSPLTLTSGGVGSHAVVAESGGKITISVSP